MPCQVRAEGRPEKTRSGKIGEPVVLDYWLGGGRLMRNLLASSLK